MTAADERWFLSTSSGTAQVVCFPHAGGNPRTFLDWQPVLGPDVELVAVCVPGRGYRAGEPAPAGVSELADGAAVALRHRLDRPTVLYGHSLGGLIAFEVARLLRGEPALRGLVTSGCAAPSVQPTPHVRWAAGLAGRAFAEAAGRYEGLDPRIVADEELQEVLLADMRYDVGLLAGYRYRPAEPLDIGISLVNGRDDPHTDDGTLEPWRRETLTQPRFHRRDGGHFFFERDPEAVVGVLRELLPARHVEVI
jgi:surfactin synthase thioesterase subunit